MAETNLQVFSGEFGEIRTLIIDDEPYFVGIDVAEKLEYQNGSRDIKAHVDDCDKKIIPLFDGRQNRQTIVINESGFYSLVFQSKMKKAKEFKHWVTSEVLPSIRKTGNYNMNMTDEEKIRLIAKGNVKLNERIDKVEDKISSLENDMPLYGCEIDEVQKHIKRKVVDVLGGKNTSAYKDSSVRSSVFADIYRQLKREYGCVSTCKSIKRKYIADVHEFIDCYLPPTVLSEQIENSNAQMCMSF